MKKKCVCMLLGIILMITGLAVSLTVLHAALLGLYTGGYVLRVTQFLSLIKNSGMVPVLMVGGITYIAGLILIFIGCKQKM